MDRGSELFEDEETGATFLWKRCEVPGCKHMVCVRMSDKWCWPHLMSGGAPVQGREVSETEPVK